MAYRTLRTDLDRGILTLRLHRPERLNAFSTEMQGELLQLLDEIDRNDDVRVVIATGEGRAFCAGADLGGGGGTFDRSAEEASSEHRDGGGLVTLRLYECRKPFIAAINGPAVGVGVTMTLPMDIRLASTTARFGFVFARRGIVPEAASSYFLPRIVGISRAAEWCYTGRIFSADEALEGRLVRSVHEPDDLLPAARALAVEIADNAAPVSVALSRRMMWRMLGASHPMEAHRVDSRGIRDRGASADAREGVVSFLEKRPARFPVKVSDGLPDIFPAWVEPTFE